ncbi:MAG: cysteine desulfurase family protein [Eubacteriales bacterium]|nr:cysteine desulfurase family protein [Eubacteriales bacterium]
MRVYADQAATTALGEKAWAAMEPWLRSHFGNPSALYEEGRAAREQVEKSREITARLLGAKPRELYFTSGGTEADNWALRLAAEAGARQGRRHLIVSAIEHHAVLHTARRLEREGFFLTVLPVRENGLVSPEELEKALRPDTALVSVMYANNEVGTIQPVYELGSLCRAHGVLFHTDAVQAAGHLPIDLSGLLADLLSLSAHKFHGPKGIGALYVREGVQPERLLEGGAQERGFRAGTENVAGIAGLAAALEESLLDRERKDRAVRALRDSLEKRLLEIPGSFVNGDRQNRLPGNLSIGFADVEAEALLLYLDMKGIAVSAGAACAAGALEPSHVLTAMGLSAPLARSTLRISLDETNTRADVDYIAEVLPAAVARLRSMAG